MTQTMDRQQAPAPADTTAPQYTITDADRKRTRQISEAWKAYDGDLPKPLQIGPDGLDDNVMSNRCEPIVNTGVDFLFGKELEISIEEGAPQEAQDFLDDTWGIEEVRIPLLQDLAMNGAMSGRAYLRIVPSNDKIGRQTTYRLVPIDPSTVYVQTAPQDCDTVLLYCIQYACTELVNGQSKEVWYREEIARLDPDGNASQGKPDDDDTWVMRYWTFTSQHGVMPRKTDWRMAGPDIAWPYNFPPIFSCKNRPRPNEFWGRPDITPDLIGMNNSYNFTQSNAQKINKIYGHPWPYAAGIGDSDLHNEPGRFTLLPPGPDTKIGAIEFKSDLPSSLAFAKEERSDINEQSNVPDIATGRSENMPRGNISGIALELLFMPLLKKTEGKRKRYGKLIIDVSKALLVLNGMDGNIKVSLEWQNPLPQDDLSSWQVVPMMQQAGISNTTIQRQRGFDPEEELELSQTEDAVKLQSMIAQQQALAPMQQQQPGQPPNAQGQQQPGQSSPFLGRG